MEKADQAGNSDDKLWSRMGLMEDRLTQIEDGLQKIDKADPPARYQVPPVEPVEEPPGAPIPGCGGSPIQSVSIPPNLKLTYGPQEEVPELPTAAPLQVGRVAEPSNKLGDALGQIAGKVEDAAAPPEAPPNENPIGDALAGVVDTLGNQTDAPASVAGD
jgi:hypothetical protein